MAAIVFLVLLAGHLLGDWVAQTDWQATNKPRSWAALAAHVASYHLVMGLLLLIPVLRDGWPAAPGTAGSRAQADHTAVVNGLTLLSSSGPVKSAPSTRSRCGNAGCTIGPGSTCSARASCVQDDDHRQTGTRRVVRIGE